VPVSDFFAGSPIPALFTTPQRSGEEINLDLAVCKTRSRLITFRMAGCFAENTSQYE